MKKKFLSVGIKDRVVKVEIGRDTIEWISIAKGIGIILVVAGHFESVTAPTYWSEILNIINSFHMPLFFILSGYLYSHGKYSYSVLMKSKIKRLLYPFFTIAGIFFLFRYVAGLIVTLGHPLNIDSVKALLLDPIHSYMPVLWYVYALFFIFAIYPLLRLFLNNLFILTLLLVINIVFGSKYLALGVPWHMPFFVFGVIIRDKEKALQMVTNAGWRYIFATLIIFAAAFVTQHFINIVSWCWYPRALFLGTVGSLIVINISYAFCYADLKIKGILHKIGYYSMTIYLFHILFVSGVRIGFHQVFKQIHLPFELVAFVAITCGVLFPLVLEEKLLRKNWVTRKFILGLETFEKKRR